MPEGSGQRTEELVFTFTVRVLNRGDDGWEAQCDEAGFQVTGVTSPRVLAEEVAEHFEGIARRIGEVRDPTRFRVTLAGPDADAVLAETRSADREPADPVGADSGDQAKGSGKDPEPDAGERISRTVFQSARLTGVEDEVEDLKSRVEELEDQVEDLRSRIDDLDGELL